MANSCYRLVPKFKVYNCLVFDVFDTKTSVLKVSVDANILPERMKNTQTVNIVGNANEVSAAQGSEFFVK
jgi:hypothetical protein